MQKFCKSYQSRFVLFIWLFLVGQNASAQSRAQSSILFYSIKNVSTEWSSVQLEKSNSSEDIQKYLKQNTSGKQEVKDAFLVPTILNVITQNTEFDAINDFKDRSQVVSRYRGANEFLIIISINSFGELLEYQFHLSRYVSGNYNQLNQSSFFIDPRNENHYNTIKREVQQTFNGYMGKNKAPIPKIRLDGKIVDGSGHTVFYRSNQDTIALDGFSSVDDNTPKNYLNYEWRVVKRGEENAFIADFNFEQGQQSLVIADSGTYTFYLQVSDGVAWSDDSTSKVTIHVINQATLNLHKEVEYILQNSLFNDRKRSFLKSGDRIPFHVSVLQGDQTTLHFTYVDSRSRSQKYFLDADPDLQNNRLRLSFAQNTLADTVQRFTRLSGIMVDTSAKQNPGGMNYQLSTNIKPGLHRFALNTEYKGIKSNTDTVYITVVEKSALSFSFGVLSYDILRNGEYTDRVNVTTLKFGLRGYVTQRLSLDLDILFPNTGQNERISDASGPLKFSMHSAAIKVNYDFFPFNYQEMISEESFAYLTLFGSFQQMIITGEDDSDAQLLGFGLKPRMQLFKQNKKIGALYLEGEIGFQFDLARNIEPTFYDSWFYGLSLVYGFNKY
jgi:hypothetical protein